MSSEEQNQVRFQMNFSCLSSVNVGFVKLGWEMILFINLVRNVSSFIWLWTNLIFHSWHSELILTLWSFLRHHLCLNTFEVRYYLKAATRNCFSHWISAGEGERKDLRGFSDWRVFSLSGKQFVKTQRVSSVITVIHHRQISQELDRHNYRILSFMSQPLNHQTIKMMELCSLRGRGVKVERRLLSWSNTEMMKTFTCSSEKVTSACPQVSNNHNKAGTEKPK